jgi:hypothetical protein
MVSGWHILHILLEILINAAVIILVDSRSGIYCIYESKYDTFSPIV